MYQFRGSTQWDSALRHQHQDWEFSITSAAGTIQCRLAVQSSWLSPVGDVLGEAVIGGWFTF